MSACVEYLRLGVITTKSRNRMGQYQVVSMWQRTYGFRQQLDRRLNRLWHFGVQSSLVT